MQLNSIKSKDRNPRRITDEALLKLTESIKRDPEFMNIRPIVIDNDNVIIGGNQRFKAIQSLNMTEIPDSWVIKAGNLTQEQLKRFTIVDNAPSGMAGDWNLDVLKEDWALTELIDLGFKEYQFDDLSLDGFGLDNNPTPDDTYTKKITAPVYLPTNEKPAGAALYNTKKSDTLIEEINTADISLEDKEFLIAAAQRHIVFDYQQIANYYANSDKTTQELMEKSALIIIDFNQAIENGYVKLAEGVANQYSVDYPDGSEDDFDDPK